MIALAGALRFQSGASRKPAGAFAVRPRWPLGRLNLKGSVGQVKIRSWFDRLTTNGFLGYHPRGRNNRSP